STTGLSCRSSPSPMPCHEFLTRRDRVIWTVPVICPPSQRRRRVSDRRGAVSEGRIFRPFMRAPPLPAKSPRGAEQPHDDAVAGRTQAELETSYDQARRTSSWSFVDELFLRSFSPNSNVRNGT